ncbi:hypothetical protein JB92DRAFT_3096185 [Gautieria morchelliformis]|nr:hypothetical protein JB92DRAFT_3096185 [Gautieria morchelliformis]
MLQKQDGELKTLLITELLKSKEQEINAAKEGEAASLDKCARYRIRAKDALIKQKALEVELNELRTQKAKHDQRVVNAEAALEKALLLKEEVNTLKTTLEMKTSEFNNSAEKYKACAQNAKSDYERAEYKRQRLTIELEEAKRECEATRAAQSLAASSDCRPRDVSDPEEVRASIKGPRRRTFTETQIKFAHNQQHGYFLYPQRVLKYDKRHPEGVWVKNNSFQIASPFEAFYSRDGVWYYIGTYQGFIICDAPWETLSEWPEQNVAQVIDSTIIGYTNNNRNQAMRKTYRNGEVVASYVGIRCIGFQYDLYEKLRQAAVVDRSSEGEPQKQSKRKRKYDAITNNPKKKRKAE